MCAALAKTFRTSLFRCFLPWKRNLSTIKVNLLLSNKHRFFPRCISANRLSSSGCYEVISSTNVQRYLNSIYTECSNLNDQIRKGEILDEKRNEYLSSNVRIFRALQELYATQKDYKELQQLLEDTSDKDLQAAASDESKAIVSTLEKSAEKVLAFLVPDEPEDSADLVFEVNAGVGGQEAMLFCGEMLQMYMNFCAYKGWAIGAVSIDKTDLGGIRQASATVSGNGVYKWMKFESGVHRVQRVPKTERSGRLHTSTVTVAILPQPKEINIEIRDKDIRIDTFRASGPGGQKVNKTDSAVRITHIPTGTVSECQETRSQHDNKKRALDKLKFRIYQKQYEIEVDKHQRNRKLQVGAAGRSEKIRTYNFPQDRITDHRLKDNFHHIDELFLGGDSLEAMLLALQYESRKERLLEIVGN